MKVDLMCYSGSDLLVVNAARVSFAKESDWDEVAAPDSRTLCLELKEKDAKLINYLAREGHCFDGETEVFTDRGWLKWEDVSDQTNLAAVCPSGTMQFEKPIEIINENYSGPMLLVEQEHVSICVTPNHRMWISLRHKDGFSRFKIAEAKDIYNKQYRVQTSAILLSGNEGSYDEGYYLGFFLGDGCKASINRVSFHLKKEVKISNLIKCLEKLGKQFSIRNNEDGTVTISVTENNKWFIGTSGTKEIPETVFNTHSLAYRKGLLDGLLDTDGHRKRSSWVYSTMSEKLAIGLQRLATGLGEYCKFNKEKTTGCYNLVILSRSVSPRLNDAGEYNDSWVDYNGKVYCASVSTGLLLVRRNNCVCISGNSLPFRHPQITLRCKAPMFVKNQLVKHQVGFSWSEESRRYIDSEPEFYWPEKWRKRADNVKQGSSDEVCSFMYEHVPGRLCDVDDTRDEHIKSSISALLSTYRGWVRKGLAPEQARMFLPQNMYVNWVWTGSLLGYAQMVKARTHETAQRETQEFANKVADVIAPLYPVSWKALMRNLL